MNNTIYTIEDEKRLTAKLKDLVDKHPRSYFSSLHTAKLAYLFNYITYKTPMLADDFYKISTKCHWVLNDLSDFPVCPTCGKQYGRKQNMPVTPRKDGTSGYFNFCSKACLNKSPGHIKQVKDTMLNRYGVDNPAKIDDVKDKIKETCLDKYGVEYVTQTKAFKTKAVNTWLDNYGVSNPNKVKSVRTKIKNTCLDRYGVEYYTQSTECAKHRKSRVKYDGVWFDSKAELNYYKHCKANGQDVRRADVRLTYIHDDKVCYYYPDFIVDRQLVEIKGDHFFRLNRETGDEEMFMPFSSWGADKPMAESEHIGLCDKYNAKYNCMLDNDVIIIKSSEVNNV